VSSIENKQASTWFSSDNRRLIVQEYGIFLAFLLLAFILSLSNEYFLTPGNISNVLLQTSINGVLAIGMTFVILTRGIDLSVGSVVALAGIVSASFATTSATAGIAGGPYPFYVALAIGILVGLACGALVGLIVSRFAVPAFVATLGMLSAARGMTLIYGGGKPVPALTPEFRWIGTGNIFGIPMPVILLAVVFRRPWWVLTAPASGATSMPSAAIRMRPRPRASMSPASVLVYMISGSLSGLAGMMLSARTGSALPQAGVAYELDAIAAVVIGGTSLSGGVGRVTGTLIGALIIGVMNNGLDLMGIQSYYQQVLKGALIVGAVMLDQKRNHGL
jgi:putative xylitol transport system permease protein